MEELKVKVVEVSQEKEQPQGNDYIRMDYRKQHQCSTL